MVEEDHLSDCLLVSQFLDIRFWSEAAGLLALTPVLHHRRSNGATRCLELPRRCHEWTVTLPYWMHSVADAVVAAEISDDAAHHAIAAGHASLGPLALW